MYLIDFFIQTGVKLSGISTKTDQDIVLLCIEGRRDAWDDFCRRFIPILLNSIRATLRGYGDIGKKMSNDEDVLWGIYEIFFTRLYKKSLLSRCSNLEGIRYWLSISIANQTKDWMKKNFRDKELPRFDSENTMISLDSPLYDDSFITLYDSNLSVAGLGEPLQETIHRESSFYNEQNIFAKNVLTLFAMLKHDDEYNRRRNYWIVRISCIALYPLTYEEEDELVHFTQVQRNSLLSRLDIVRARIETVMENREVALGRSVLLWHKLIRAETRLKNCLNDDSAEVENMREKIKKDIANISGRREKLLKKVLKIPRPTSQEIVDVMGAPQRLTSQVPTILSRLYQELFVAANKDFPGKS